MGGHPGKGQAGRLRRATSIALVVSGAAVGGAGLAVGMAAADDAPPTCTDTATDPSTCPTTGTTTDPSTTTTTDPTTTTTGTTTTTPDPPPTTTTTQDPPPPTTTTQDPPPPTTTTSTTPTTTVPSGSGKPGKPGSGPQSDPYAGSSGIPSPSPTGGTTSRPNTSTGTSQSAANAKALDAALPASAKVPVPPTVCDDAGLEFSAATRARVEAALRCLTDAQRREAGMDGRLGVDGQLDQEAEGHAADMARRGFFAHNAPPPTPAGVTFEDRLATVGYAAAAWGENLAWGQSTAYEVIQAWMASPTHRHTLLDPAFTELGVGIAIGADGRLRFAQAFGRPPGADVGQAAAALSSRIGAKPKLVVHAKAQRKGSRVRIEGSVTGPGRTAGAKLAVTVSHGDRKVTRTVRLPRDRRFRLWVGRPGHSRRVAIVVKLDRGSAAPVLLSA
ncbi:CAP domain-containing protein [Conexibacter sp. SYSU D00693]|uniref:CAP domain-containing protein n=1 Tax=Conexibacter sp. SYSU D00693 TaxID=2812560 RepID=UPI00196B020D|nr:CAP domain-containing protein [Conexibacter sp. SYSU D00693]